MINLSVIKILSANIINLVGSNCNTFQTSSGNSKLDLWLRLLAITRLSHHFLDCVHILFLITFHSLCCPVLPWRFQQPGLFPVWDEEAVVVSEAALILHARSSLAIFLQQLSNNIHGLLSCIGSLKSEPGKLQSQRFMFCFVYECFSQMYSEPTEEKDTLNCFWLALCH